MTMAEKILVRWLSILAAGVTAALGVVTASSVEIDKTFLVILLAIAAFLSAVAAAATTEQGGITLGTRKDIE